MRDRLDESARVLHQRRAFRRHQYQRMERPLLRRRRDYDVDVEGRLIILLPTDELRLADLDDGDISALINDSENSVEIVDATVHQDYPL